MNENPKLKGFFDFIRGIGDMFRGGKQEMISPVPDKPVMQPEPTPDPFLAKGWEKTGDNSYKWPEQPAAPQQPEAPQQPGPIIPPEMRTDVSPNSPIFDFTKYQETGEFEIPETPPEIGSALRDIFGTDAEKAAVVAGTENPQYRADAININSNGSRDIGIMQINSDTLKDFMRRKPKQVASIGIQSDNDLFDPMKNMKMGKLIMDEQGFRAWYAPRDRGYGSITEGTGVYAR